MLVMQRWRDRRRAQYALGRSLTRTEEVHHHSLIQLVICQDHSYHRLLHARAKALGRPYKTLRVLFRRKADRAQSYTLWHKAAHPGLYWDGPTEQELKDAL